MDKSTINSDIINMNITYNLDKPLVISLENNYKENKNSQTYEQTLKNKKWDYVFIGEGVKWCGFITKINTYFEHLKTLHPEKIVVLTDSRDVFCVREPNNFIDDINNLTNINDKIIISSEIFLLGQMDWSDESIKKELEKDKNYFFQGIPIKKYWEHYNKLYNIPLRKYVNSGLIIGKVKNLINAFEWMIINKFNDDQLGLSNYANNFPQLVYLDFDANLLHTSCFGVDGGLYDVKQKFDSPTLAELFGFANYFLHIPGINISKGQKYMYEYLTELIKNNSFANENHFAKLYDIKIIDKITYNYFEKK